MLECCHPQAEEQSNLIKCFCYSVFKDCHVGSKIDDFSLASKTIINIMTNVGCKKMRIKTILI